MSNEKVFQMKLQKVYPLLVAKAEKKGRSRGEVDAAACWLTGYSQEQLAALLESDIAYGDFFRQAPAAPSQPGPYHRLGVRGEGGDHPGPAAAGNPVPGQAGRRAGQGQALGEGAAAGVSQHSPPCQYRKKHSHLFWVGAFLSKRKRATAQGSGPLWRDTQILTL